MTREIKFRVWDVVEQKMYNPPKDAKLNMFWDKNYGSELYQLVEDENGYKTCGTKQVEMMQ